VLEDAQKRAVYQEAAYLLKFSGVLFDSFGEVGDRVLFFRLLGIVLTVAVQNKGALPVRALRDFDDMKRFLDKMKPRSKDYLFGKLIEDFGNSKGAFFDMPETQGADRALTLNEHFYRAAREYLGLFVDRLSDGRLRWDVSASKRPAILHRLQTLMAFQHKRHMEEWTRFVGQLALKGQNEAHTEREIKEELLGHAPYWSMFLTVWRHHLGDPDKGLSVSLNGLTRATSDAMRDIDPRELLSCLNFLTRDDGPKIFEKTKRDGTELYLLNADKYESSFTAYSQAMIRLHEELLDHLQQPEAVRS
jgi:hypothetical protein